MQFVQQMADALKLDRGRVLQAVLAAVLMLLGMGTFKPGMPSQPSAPAVAPAPAAPKIVVLDGSADSIPLDLIQSPRAFSQSEAIRETSTILDPAGWYEDHKDQVKAGLDRPIVRLLLRRHLAKLDPDEAVQGRQLLDRLERGEKLRGLDPARVTKFLERIIPILEMIVPFVPPPYDVAVQAAIEFLKLILANRLTPEMVDAAAAIAPCKYMLCSNLDPPLPDPARRRISLEDLWDRVEAGEEITIAVGIPATGKQYSCEAPRCWLVCGNVETKGPGVYRCYLDHGTVTIAVVLLPVPMPACANGRCTPLPPPAGRTPR